MKTDLREALQIAKYFATPRPFCFSGPRKLRHARFLPFGSLQLLQRRPSFRKREPSTSLRTAFTCRSSPTLNSNTNIYRVSANFQPRPFELGNLPVTGRYAKSKCRAKLSEARAELFEPSRKRLNVELFRRSDRYSTEPDRAKTEKQRAIKRLTPLTAFSHENHG